jgi:RNA-directed DNA polymerase
MSYRKDRAAQRTDAQQTNRQRARVPDGRDTGRSINASAPVDSQHPKDRATSPALNEVTELGLSGRRCAATGAGDPPDGQVWAGEPTKPIPRCNGGDTQNSAVSSHVEPTQQSASKPSTQEVQAAKWQAVNWPELEARVFRTQRAIFEAFKQGKKAKGHRLQTRLWRSHNARLLAVHNATNPNKGADTAGTDGVKSLSDAAKWRLALKIRFDLKPMPLRRTFIPKNGNELRPLGIPTIRDRAIQHLIKLALEPAAETLLSPEQFGFRPGRGCWDAAMHIRLRLRKPSYVLDADISKFFDRISHDAILRAIPGPTCLINAIRRILKGGILEGVEITHPDTGTMQGGPLSPLLANLVLASLAADIHKEFPKGRSINGEIIVKVPYTPSCADDFLVIHESQSGLMAVRAYVEQWLALRGLELHPDKTAIRNTATMADGYRGFRFLGFGFRHHRIGRHQSKGKEWYLWTGPSQESLNRVYQKCVDIIDASKRSRKRNGAIKDRARKGKATPEEVMVIKLNNLIRGWCGYHRPFFAKDTFSTLDHQLFTKLWKWALRKHPSRKRAWVVEHWFNSAKPWRFTVTSPSTGKRWHLRSAADTTITRHFQVKPEKSWFDGDWAYWAKRAGHYPMLTARAGTALKRQQGKCPLCKGAITIEDRIVLATYPHERGPRTSVVHRNCADALRNATTEPAFVGSVLTAARCWDDWHAGLTEPTVPRGIVGSTSMDAPDGASENLLTGAAHATPGGISFT